MSRPCRLSRLSPLLVMALIFCFSSLPGTPGGTGGAGPLQAMPSWLHNFAHIPAYALLAASWCVALGAPWENRWALVAGLLTIGYGGLDEWHQSFVHGRECSAADLLLDALGAGLGLWAMRWFRLLRPAPARPAPMDR